MSDITIWPPLEKWWTHIYQHIAFFDWKKCSSFHVAELQRMESVDAQRSSHTHLTIRLLMISLTHDFTFTNNFILPLSMPCYHLYFLVKSHCTWMPKHAHLVHVPASSNTTMTCSPQQNSHLFPPLHQLITIFSMLTLCVIPACLVSLIIKTFLS